MWPGALTWAAPKVPHRYSETLQADIRHRKHATHPGISEGPINATVPALRLVNELINPVASFFKMLCLCGLCPGSG